MKILLILIALLIMPCVSAATLHGDIYDLDFEKVNNVIVGIDSIPQQSIVSTGGSYSFELNPGNYVLKASYYVGDTLVSNTEENVKIVEEGDYVLDLILFPNYDEDIVEDFEVESFEDRFNYFYLIIFILAIVVAFILFKKKKKVKYENDNLDNVLKFIKKEGGRTTQKDIRKAFSLSEAKASLIVTELEHKKIVKRIKKGRANVIILNK